MQAICDHKLRFTWIDISRPGSTSDYLAWITSGLCQDLDHHEGIRIIRDNKYIKKLYMSVPLKGQQVGANDAYNFYLSQLRITIERACGDLVHHWSILRGPLLFPPPKVAPIIMCLCRLYNFCTNSNESNVKNDSQVCA